MKFLHWEMTIAADDIVQVTLNSQANVMLLDDSNFRAYRAGRGFRYQGGLAKQSPIRLSPPFSGHWHIVVDLGGFGGRVNASVAVI